MKEPVTKEGDSIRIDASQMKPGRVYNVDTSQGPVVFIKGRADDVLRMWEVYELSERSVPSGTAGDYIRSHRGEALTDNSAMELLYQIAATEDSNLQALSVDKDTVTFAAVFDKLTAADLCRLDGQKVRLTDYGTELLKEVGAL